MNQPISPNTIKSIVKLTRSNIKALNPFNFTHSTAFHNKLKGIPLKFIPIFVGLLLLILFSGYVSNNCPPSYEVVKEKDRIRCYTTEETIVFNDMVGAFETVFSAHKESKRVEVSCPLACVEAVK